MEEEEVGEDQDIDLKQAGGHPQQKQEIHFPSSATATTTTFITGPLNKSYLWKI